MTRFIALVSGKGGVGKTSLTLALGHALAKSGKRVLLLDANLETPNLGLHIGEMSSRKTLNHFMRQEVDLHEIVKEHQDYKFSYIPSSTSYIEFQKTNPQDLKKVFDHLHNTYDFVLVDAPSGVGNEVYHVLKNTDEAIVIVNPTVSSVMEGLKSSELAKSHGNVLSGVILNMTSWLSRHEMKKEEVEGILGTHVIANIRHDKKFKKALHNQAPVNHLHPSSRTAKEVNRIKDHLLMNFDN